MQTTRPQSIPAKGHTGRSLSLLSDEDVVKRAQLGEKNAAAILIERYRGRVEVRASQFFGAGLEPEDLCQEGMIGLYRAIRCFQPHLENRFGAFADLCVRRQIQSAVRGSRRIKHDPLNSAEPLGLIQDLVPYPHKTPIDLQLVLNQDLTNFEISVLNAHLAGLSYTEIGVSLSRVPKAIDNALQRAKRKILAVLTS